MQRILASVSISALFAVSAAAQCLDTTSIGTATVTTGDDVINASHFALGLTYPNPMGGALAGGYTHVRLSTNGWIMLTDGVNSTGLPTATSYGSTADTNAGLGGGAGSFPMLCPYWGDANVFAANGADVYVKASTGPGVPAEITWFQGSDYAYTTITKSCKTLIHDSGLIQFQYSAGFAVQGAAARYVGVSTRNGIATVAPQTALGAVGATSGTSGMCFKTFPTGSFNLQDHEILFVQNGTGGWDVANTCGTTIFPPPASVSVGAGCYDIPGIPHDSFHQFFPLAADASLALQGNAMTMVPIASPPGYAAVWVAGGASSGSTTYVPPGTAPASTGVVTLPTTDDGVTVITPSVALNTPFGPFATLTVAHNAVLFMGGTGTAGATATEAAFSTQTSGGFFSWADYYDVPTTSGKIKTEEGTVGSDQVLYVTWDGVWRWASPAVASPSTLQFQVNLTTGIVSIVWVTLDPQDISIYDAQLIGFTAPGASVPDTSIDLATALPVTTFPDVAPIAKMAMAVDVLPVIVLPSGDSVPMTWTVTNVPEAAHIFPQARACNIVLSIGAAFAPGYDLGPLGINIGAAGCNGYLLTADAFIDVSTVSPVGTCTTGPLTFPGTPSLIGLVLSSQAIAIVPPGVYNGNVNDIGGGNGLVTSNAVQQTYNPL